MVVLIFENNLFLKTLLPLVIFLIPVSLPNSNINFNITSIYTWVVRNNSVGQAIWKTVARYRGATLQNSIARYVAHAIATGFAAL